MGLLSGLLECLESSVKAFRIGPPKLRDRGTHLTFHLSAPFNALTSPSHHSCEDIHMCSQKNFKILVELLKEASNTMRFLASRCQLSKDHGNDMA